MTTPSSDKSLAKLFGMLITEVFQKKDPNPNKPFNRSLHPAEDIPLTDWVQNSTHHTNTTYIWGPGGTSAYTDRGSGGGDSAARWGEAGTWA